MAKTKKPRARKPGAGAPGAPANDRRRRGGKRAGEYAQAGLARLQVAIPVDLHQWVSVQAVMTGRDKSEIVAEALTKLRAATPAIKL